MKSYLSIKNNREFQFLFKKGNSYVTQGFVCYFKRAEHPKNRLGIVASKKVGNAVLRNRAKRVIREAFRIAVKERIIGNFTYDFVFVARAKTPYLKSTQVYELMEKLFLELENT